MQIVSLSSENVKRLKAVTITPSSNVVVIKGNNGQGKSSVLDSIAYALGGKDSHPPEVIRRGEERATILLDLGDLVVERRWTSNERSTVTVKSKEGAKFSSPQAMLDGLVGRLSFDPLAFMRLKAKEQADTLRQLVGLDFTALDAERAEAFQQRTLVNREVAQLEAALKRMPEVEAPDAPVKMEDLFAEERVLREALKKNDERRSALRVAQEQWSIAAEAVKESRARVEYFERQLQEARADQERHEKGLAVATAAGKELRAEVDALVDPDLEDLQRRMREVEATNAKVRARHQRQAEQARLEERQAEAREFTETITRLDASKAKQLAEAPFPVPGLGIDAEGLTLNGLPVSQASSAEQLRVSLAMGLALNPKLKVVLIRDGSLLDATSMELVARMAADAGAQVWVEVVGKGGEVGVVIEDGEVQA